MEKDKRPSECGPGEGTSTASENVAPGKKVHEVTAKEYLSQLRLLDMRINRKLREAEELHGMTEGRAIAYDSDKVQTSPQNSQEQIICNWIEMQSEIDKQIDEYLDRKHEIIDQILSLDDPRYIQLLCLRYVPGDDHKTKRLEEIACIMEKPNGNHYDYDYIRRLHGWALQAFEKKFWNVIQKSH